jgi:hypothetical protein
MHMGSCPLCAIYPGVKGVVDMGPSMGRNGLATQYNRKLLLFQKRNTGPAISTGNYPFQKCSEMVLHSTDVGMCSQGCDGESWMSQEPVVLVVPHPRQDKECSGSGDTVSNWLLDGCDEANARNRYKPDASSLTLIFGTLIDPGY